jgi:hypothetical protein
LNQTEGFGSAGFFADSCRNCRGAVGAAKATSPKTSDPPTVSSVIQNLKTRKKTFLK